MIGLDSNVIIRYIMQDDAHQSALANRLIDSFSPASCGYISLICLTELYWVLDHRYKLPRSQIQKALRSILTSETLLVENTELAGKAFHAYSIGNADFDDCLISQCSKAGGCASIMTFDKIAAKSAGMTLLV